MTILTTAFEKSFRHWFIQNIPILRVVYKGHGALRLLIRDISYDINMSIADSSVLELLTRLDFDSEYQSKALHDKVNKSTPEGLLDGIDIPYLQKGQTQELVNSIWQRYLTSKSKGGKDA